MTELPFEVIEEDVSVLLIQPSFLCSYFCRCDVALAFIICKTLEELGLNEGFGGKELRVTSIPTVLEVHPWAGYGSKDRSKGQELGSEGR